MDYYKTLHINGEIIKLHFAVKQMKLDECIGILHSLIYNYVKFANMEGFRRDSHICAS